jgi:hypothetical protein
MKIGGVDPKTLPTEEILVLPRGEKQIVFRARGVQDYDEFDALCPEPKPPGILKPKEGWVPNPDEPGYKDMMKTYGLKRMGWLVIKSLEPSNVEWDEVSLDNPSTWTNWQDEFLANGFTLVECNRIQHLTFEANCLDEAKLEKAREAFLRGQEPVPSEYSGQSIAPETSPSGKPVSE